MQKVGVGQPTEGVVEQSDGRPHAVAVPPALTGHGSKSRVIFENLFFAKRQKFPGITSPPAIVASASHMGRSIESL